MYTMHNVCTILTICGGTLPSRWAIIRRMGHPSRRYGYPAVHRAIRHGYVAYGHDGQSVHLTDDGREYLATGRR